MPAFKLKPILIPLLMENETANVIAGNKKQGIIVLRFKDGIEWRVDDLDKEFAGSLPNDAFELGSKWRFTPEGEFVETILAPRTSAKKGVGTGSMGKVPVA